MGVSTRANRYATPGLVTLRQVAERAGVHPGTVSRALQGDERVAPATLENIQRIAKEMNYTPNGAARILAVGKTETVAIITGPTHENYYGRLLHFLGKELAASNYKCLVLNAQELKRKRDVLSVINRHSVDGIIAMDALPRVDALIHSDEGSVLPCVFAGVANMRWTLWSDVDIVRVDLSGAVREAVQALIDSGCRRIAYLANDAVLSSPSDEVRAHVYSSMMNEIGCATEIINLQVDYDHLHALLPGRLIRYVQKYGAPDGVLCQNDEIAIASQRVFRELGLRIPQDVQIVGCDGLPYMECMNPPLSTIEQPAKEMCAIAWQFLQRRIETPSLPQQQATLEAQFHLRSSLKVGGNSAR